MSVKPFAVSVLKEVLGDYHPKYTSEDLLALYSFTGGVAKYVQQFMDAGATAYKKMLSHMIKEDSTFIGEGRNMLIEEFGTEYATYFTILSAIARGENTRAKIEALVKHEIGGYLTKLEQDYGLIAKSTPIFAKVETKNVRYVIEDNFLIFWFRFIYKYGYMIEVGNYEGLKTIIDRDYKTFSGKMLEKYFRRSSFNVVISPTLAAAGITRGKMSLIWLWLMKLTGKRRLLRLNAKPKTSTSIYSVIKAYRFFEQQAN